MLTISWSTETTELQPDGDLGLQTAEHTLRFDAVTKENHTASSLLTEHAVERGASLADHKRPDPRRLEIEAVVTNTPIDAPPPSGYGGANVSADVDKSDAGANVLQFGQEFDRVSDVFATLGRLVTEPTIVTITTRVTTYENMTIIAVSAPRENRQRDWIKFTIDVAEVRVAETQTVDSPTPREPRGRRDDDNGSQESEDSDANAQGQSTASALVENATNGDYGEGVQDFVSGLGLGGS